MARKLFSLRNVPEDEAEEIRMLLREHGIEFHETSSGFLDLMTAAIWVDDDSRFEVARALLDNYQQARYQQARTAYHQLRTENRHTKFSDQLRREPLKLLLYLLLALGLLLLTTLPFWL